MQSRSSRIFKAGAVFTTVSSTVSMLGGFATGNSVGLAAINSFVGSVAFTGALASLESEPHKQPTISLRKTTIGMTNVALWKNLLAFIVIPTLTNLSGSLLQYLVGTESPSFMEQTGNTLVGGTLLAAGFRTTRWVRDWISPPQMQQAAAAPAQNTLMKRASLRS